MLSKGLDAYSATIFTSGLVTTASIFTLATASVEATGLAITLAGVGFVLGPLVLVGAAVAAVATPLYNHRKRF